MVNYQNGKIYAIRSHTTDNVYVGSTTRALSKRMADHRSNYKRFQAGKFGYMTSFEIIKHDDAYIELLVEYPCDNNEQLHKKEGQQIREMDCVNKYVSQIVVSL